MKKLIQDLIDELTITNTKIALLLEKGEDATKEELLNVQRLNRYRVELKNAIGKYFNESMEGELKTYRK